MADRTEDIVNALRGQGAVTEVNEVRQFRIVRGGRTINVEVTDNHGSARPRVWLHLSADDDATVTRSLSGETADEALVTMDWTTFDR